MPAILGVSALYHDSAAALLVDGEIVAAAQEERFTRKKHDDGFPFRAIRYCLEEGGLTPEDLDYVGFYDKPFRKLERLLETYLGYAPRGYESFSQAIPTWLREKQFVPRNLDRALEHRFKKRYIFSEHHESHAASAFFSSPFEEAAILTLDGVGEWATATYGSGRGNKIHLTHDMRFPHSLGLLYSAFTYFTGFKVNGGEYKLMGLAPYGEPLYRDLILEKLLDLKPDGSFLLDMSYFNYCQGLTMTSGKFDDLFGGPPRQADEPLTQREMDIAASIQEVTEEIMLRCAQHVQRETGARNLCLAGGVALNCVGNGRILREGPFDDIWIQPAAGDAGGALGVAQLIWYQILGNERRPQRTDTQSGSLLGPSYSDDEIEKYLESVGAAYQRIDDDEALCEAVAKDIAEGKVVGWFQGRMEFGPRALGCRSILGDARRPEMQSTINVKVKFREGFRPFAPVVLSEHAHDYFEFEPGQESPYMLLVAPVQNGKRCAIPAEQAGVRGIDKLQLRRSEIPAVTHVDYSARLQTVDRQRHGIFRTMMEAFHRLTGCPVLVNTSFNLGWDPIVCTPEDAYRTFMSCDIDELCIGHFLVTKKPAPRLLSVGSERGTDWWASKLVSPCCQAGLSHRDDALVCDECGHAFSVIDGIPNLFWPHDGVDRPGDVTEIVKAFYEKTPFPNYDNHDSIRSLIEKSRRGLYARRLDETIPYDCDVLEVGCGTGQLTNFLGIAFRRVIGTDMCLNSLRLAEAFRREHGLSRVQFVQMNLFRPAVEEEQFDVVLCNGVLHHTADPQAGFIRTAQLVKPGGHVIVGLYNKYGRLLTDLRRQLFRLTRGRVRRLDPILRKGGMSAQKHTAWFEDQYRNPHESKHTVGEVLRWFDDADFEFMRAVPAARPDDDGLGGDSLFAPQSAGTRLDRFISQALQILGPGQKEGGFFLMIGRKRDGMAPSPGQVGERERQTQAGRYAPVP